MSQILVPIKLPIRLQCLCVPMLWKVETVGVKGVAPSPWFYPERNKQKADSYDIWEMRGNFFRLEEGDNEAAIEFLNGVGLFDRPDTGMALGVEAMRGRSKRDSIDRILRLLRDSESVEGMDGQHEVKPKSAGPVPAHVFWDFRRVMLEEMKPNVSPGFAHWDYQTRFAALVRLGPSAVITATAFKDALAASIRIDQLRGAKFKTCKRQDCGIPFAAVGPRKRKYCAWKCAHLMTVRRVREREARRKAK